MKLNGINLHIPCVIQPAGECRSWCMLERSVVAAISIPSPHSRQILSCWDTSQGAPVIFIVSCWRSGINQKAVLNTNPPCITPSSGRYVEPNHVQYLPQDSALFWGTEDNVTKKLLVNLATNPPLLQSLLQNTICLWD